MLTPTNLFLQAAPLPQDFRGDPQQFFDAIVDRLRIVSAVGLTTFVVGDVKPSSNQGPWLKGGTQWWVWDEDEADYVPLDITESLNIFAVSETEPTIDADSPPFWVRVTADNRVNGMFFLWNGSWQPLFNFSTGTTAERPANPIDFEKFYDTDIECQIWFERGQWRTVHGSVGDVKYVSWPTQSDALARNPGWELLGTGATSNVNWRGRVLSQAASDQGGSPAFSMVTAAGITPRAAGDLFGSETHTLITDEIPSHQHHYSTNRGAGTDGDGAAAWNQPDAGAPAEFDVDAEGGDQPHNNVQPCLALFCLRKA